MHSILTSSSATSLDTVALPARGDAPQESRESLHASRRDALTQIEAACFLDSRLGDALKASINGIAGGSPESAGDT